MNRDTCVVCGADIRDSISRYRCASCRVLAIVKGRKARREYRGEEKEDEV